MSAEYDVIGSRKDTRWRRIALLVGGVMILAVVGVALWLTILQPDTVAQEYRRPNPPVALPVAYYQAVEEQIAQALGLSVAQVKAGIRADPSEGLFGVATAHGVSPDQLYTIEIGAHKIASAQMVADGVWTQQQADTTAQYWQGRDAKALGSDMTGWFLNH